MRSKQVVIWLVGVSLLSGACSGNTELVRESAAATDNQPVVATTSTTLEQSTGTTAPDYHAMYGEFVATWNEAQATGSLDHLRRVVHPESLHLYGEDACAAHIQTLEPIPTAFTLRFSENPEYGFSSIEMDGVLLSVYLQDMQQIVYPDGPFEATWVSPGPTLYGEVWRGALYGKVLLDCGDPIAGRFPLVLAEMAESSDASGFVAQEVHLRAPDQWWIDVWVLNGACDVSIVDAASGETLIGHTIRYHTAAELHFPGQLSIEAVGDCKSIRAVTELDLVTTDITDLLPNAASVWLVALLEDENGAETWFPFVNSGELPQDISGWEIHVEGMAEPYVFADGSALGPVAEIRFHAGCGADDDSNMHLCLPNGVFEYESITLYDAAGQLVDGL